MANPKHVEMLQLGVKEWNQWRIENYPTKSHLIGNPVNRLYLSHAPVDLSGADLRNMSLYDGNAYEGICLSCANLKYADLREVYLYDANFIGADLSNANLEDADLQYANFGQAKLFGANFCNADITMAILDSADLTGVDLRNVEDRGRHR